MCFLFFFSKLGSHASPGNKLKTLSSPGINASNASKIGPMKAFVSPEPPKSGPVRTASAGKAKTIPAKTLPTTYGIHNDHHLKKTNDIRKPGDATKDSKGSASSSLRQYHPSSGITKQTANLSSDNIRKVSDTDQTYPKHKLEAVVTLSKGKTGDATDVHVMPSPPSSAKPSTSRPGSAQRFRKMVLQCRDSS